MIFAGESRKIKWNVTEKGDGNMNSQLSERIRQKQREFSKSQRYIAQYIEEHADQVAFMTASRLGQAVGVSESTVVRFATEIGYSGYPALQQAMQEMIRCKLTSVQKLERTSTNIAPEDLLDAVLEQDIDILKRTKENMDRDTFYEAVDALMGAKRVFILGAGSSLALATFLAHYLRLVFDTVQLIDATSEASILQQLVRAGEGDAIITISFPRYSRKAAKTMKYASDRGMITLAVTDTPLSPVAQYASHLLLARSDMVSFVDSLVGPLSVINALIVTIAIRKKSEVAESLSRLESIWDEYGVYEKVDESST